MSDARWDITQWFPDGCGEKVSFYGEEPFEKVVFERFTKDHDGLVHRWKLDRVLRALNEVDTEETAV